MMRRSLCLTLIALGAALAQESGLRFRADIFRRQVEEGRLLQIFEGDVVFEQGDMRIDCDKAVEYSGTGEIVFSGDVRIRDSNRLLFADSVYVYDRQKREVARGNVKVITEKDTTTADRMVYYETEDSLVAHGDVRIANVEDNIRLTGEHLRYSRPGDYAIMLENPVLIQLDSLGNETMRIVADTMETFAGGDHFRASGQVKITQPGIEATCQRADFLKAEERTVLVGSPRAWRRNQEISCDTLKIYSQDARLVRAQAVGNAVSTSEADTLNPGRWVNRLSGELITFYFDASEDLERVVVESQATSLYHIVDDNLYRGANEVTGDRIQLLFSDGAVETVQVESDPGSSTGTFKPPGL